MEMVNGGKIFRKGGKDVTGVERQDKGKESETRGIGREEVLDVSRLLDGHQMQVQNALPVGEKEWATAQWK